MLVYTVRIEVPSEAVADELARWFEDDHAGEVVRAGAIDAEIVRLDGTPVVLEARYHFASREAFAAYEAGPAAGLRADGLARFGPERGVRMSRTIGEVLLRRG